VIENHLS